jgi:hypothetical protein
MVKNTLEFVSKILGGNFSGTDDGYTITIYSQYFDRIKLMFNNKGGIENITVEKMDKDDEIVTVDDLPF